MADHEVPHKDDLLVAAVDRMLETARGAREALEKLAKPAADLRASRLSGEPLQLMLDRFMEAGGEARRLEAASAVRAYGAAVKRVRGHLIRELVREGGMTLANVARILHLSRQTVSRIYATVVRPNDPSK